MRTSMTFLGPVTTETTVKEGVRSSAFYFLVLQGGSDPIKLEYVSKDSAREAREQILNSSGSVAVPSIKLLQAIHESLKDASHQEQLADFRQALQNILAAEEEWEEGKGESVEDELWQQGYTEALGHAASFARAVLNKWSGRSLKMRPAA